MDRRKFLSMLPAPLAALLGGAAIAAPFPCVHPNEAVIPLPDGRSVPVHFVPPGRAPMRVSVEPGDPGYGANWVRDVDYVNVDGVRCNRAILTADERAGYVEVYTEDGDNRMIEGIDGNFILRAREVCVHGQWYDVTDIIYGKVEIVFNKEIT